jgi:hypothetical protein
MSVNTPVTKPLPSHPDLTIDSVEGHAEPAPLLKTLLLSVVSKTRDTPGLGHSSGPSLAPLPVSGMPLTAVKLYCLKSENMTLQYLLLSNVEQLTVLNIGSRNIKIYSFQKGRTKV